MTRPDASDGYVLKPDIPFAQICSPDLDLMGRRLMLVRCVCTPTVSRMLWRPFVAPIFQLPPLRQVFPLGRRPYLNGSARSSKRLKLARARWMSLSPAITF